MKKLLIRIFVILSILSLTACGNKKTSSEKSTEVQNSVIGTWYEVNGENDIIIWKFTEDGKIDMGSEEHFYDENITRTYDEYTIEGNILTYISHRGDKDTYKIEYTDYGFVITSTSEPDYRYELYESKEDGLLSHPDYKKSIQYYKTIADEDGYVIENGELIKYVGDAKEITIPDSVKVIKTGALTYGEETLRKVTISGTVKEIEQYAVSEMEITHIYIEEGVEKIGRQAFRQTSLKEIHFPESVKEIGEYVIDPGELEKMSDDFEIHVKKGSYAEEYFKGEGADVVQKLIVE